MSGKERNSFEELQKDLFATEAAEGFASIEPNEALKDISDLEKHLKKRVVNRQRLIIYRIAASIAVLLTVSSLFIFIEKEKSIKEIAVVTDQPASIDITQSLPITAEPDKKEFPKQPSGRKEKKSELPADIQSRKQPELPVEETKSSDYKYIDSAEKIEIQPMNEPLRSEKAAASAPPASLSEVVVTGYGVSKSESDIENLPAGYLPPQPEGGKSDFDKYIRDNLVWPDTAISGQRAVVVLNFLVRINGIIDSIKIIKSPGKQFSDEAVRLLRSGPPWKPAEENGKPVEDEVRLRIVFK